MKPLWIRVALFTLIAPGTVVGLGPWLLLRFVQRGRGFDPAGIGALGIAAAVLGLAIYARCAWEFATRGSGTPAPYDPPKRLVVSGLYRHVRNPMYVAMLLIVIGEALLARSTPVAVYAAVFAVAFHLRVRFWEEPELARTFGDDFVRYCRDVPRWLPRLRGWRAA